MIDVPFITIEGPIGIGKTSLAQQLSSHLHFHLLEEIVEENPFLGNFYQNIDEWSFQTEMFFLCNRYKQLGDIEQNYLHKEIPVIADYHISKNMIFAGQTLQQNEFKKYEQIYHILTHDMPVPNMMIYLYASLDTILTRIKKRGRDIEKDIKPIYLQQLMMEYEHYMDQFEKSHPHIPVIRIDGDHFDFVQQQSDLNKIIDLIAPHLKQRLLSGGSE